MEKTTAKRAGKYIFVGIILTACNFLIFTIIAHVILKNNDLLWVDTAISYVFAAILGYILHSKITWKERAPGKYGIVRFFIWNFITALIISPLFTWLFGFLTPVYQFVFNISSAIHLPFSYEFIESTCIFGFTTVITMTLNYLFYDKLVFGDEQKSSAVKSEDS